MGSGKQRRKLKQKQKRIEKAKKGKLVRFDLQNSSKNIPDLGINIVTKNKYPKDLQLGSNSEGALFRLGEIEIIK